MSHPDPAYRYEQDKLANLCRDYLKAHEAEDQTATQILTGMIIGQCAAIYKLSPPAGLIDVPSMFKRDEDVNER